MLRARLPSFWWWWWLCATHFLFRGFTTKCTDGLVCLPPSNRAVRVKSEASKSKDTNNSTATAALASGHGRCRGNSSTSRGKWFLLHSLLLLYCPALPAAGTAKARSLQNRSNNLVSRTCLPMSQSPTFWVKSRGCSARWRLSKPPEVTKLPRRWIKSPKIVCHNVEPLLLTFVASVNATATYHVQPLKQKIVPCANVLMGDSWVSLGP